MGSRIQHPGRRREYIVPGKVWPITCLVPRIPTWHLPGSGVLLQGGTLWRSQKDASASETKPFPGPLHPGLYLQTILVPPPTRPDYCPEGRTDLAEVEWEVEAFCRLCLDQAGGSPAVCSGLQYSWTCFVGLKGKQILPHTLPDPSYGATWPSLLLSPLSLALLLAGPWYREQLLACGYI